MKIFSSSRYNYKFQEIANKERLKWLGLDAMYWFLSINSKELLRDFSYDLYTMCTHISLSSFSLFN